jgi:hypothetical protein
MTDSDPKDKNTKGEKAGHVKQGTLKALEGSDRFTPEEQEGIAATIESEIARLRHRAFPRGCRQASGPAGARSNK